MLFSLEVAIAACTYYGMTVEGDHVVAMGSMENRYIYDDKIFKSQPTPDHSNTIGNLLG